MRYYLEDLDYYGDKLFSSLWCVNLYDMMWYYLEDLDYYDDKLFPSLWCVNLYDMMWCYLEDLDYYDDKLFPSLWCVNLYNMMWCYLEDLDYFDDKLFPSLWCVNLYGMMRYYLEIDRCCWLSSFSVQGFGPCRCRGIVGTPLDSGLSQGVGYMSCFVYDDIVSFWWYAIDIMICGWHPDMTVDDAGWR